MTYCLMYLDLSATLEIRQESVSIRQRGKSDRIKFMADRVLDGEFGGSAWHASQSPTTAAMGITHGAIIYQMKKMDPTVHTPLIGNASQQKQLPQRKGVTLLSLSLWNEEDRLRQRRRWLTSLKSGKVWACT